MKTTIMMNRQLYKGTGISVGYRTIDRLFFMKEYFSFERCNIYYTFFCFQSFTFVKNTFSYDEVSNNKSTLSFF